MGFTISILVLAFLIFFHELGHFLVAKYLGVHVEKFSIGFGPSVIEKSYRGTLYKLSLIPLGGYVQMRGQNDFNPNERSTQEGSYDTLSPLGRIFILLAGPFANFLLAGIIYFAMALSSYHILLPKIGKVLENSPAMEVLQIGDVILKINQNTITKWEDISQTIKDSAGTLEVIVNRNGEKQLLFLSPKSMSSTSIFGEEIQRRMIGISPSGDFEKVKLGLFEALAVGYERTLNASELIFTGLQKLIQGIVSHKEVGSVIAIVDITAKASEAGILAVLGFMALISVNLGVLNLLPIPALDGGHIVFNLYELIFRRPPNKKVFYYLTIAGWSILLSIMALGVYNDINRLLAS